MQDRPPFQFLTNAEFSALGADAKAQYLIRATQAVDAMTADITAHVKRRDDELEGKVDSHCGELAEPDA